MDRIWPYVAALVPSIGVGYLFYVLIKNLLEGDRNERIALARLEKQSQGPGPNLRTADSAEESHLPGPPPGS